MSAHRKKSKKSRGEVPPPVVNSLPTLPSLYAESSEVAPHFRDKVETLTDSEDETKSSISSEPSIKNEAGDENPWGFADSDPDTLKDICPEEPVIQYVRKKAKKRKTVGDLEDDFKPHKKKKKEKEKEKERDEAPNTVISSKAEKMMVNNFF